MVDQGNVDPTTKTHLAKTWKNDKMPLNYLIIFLTFLTFHLAYDEIEKRGI